MTKRSNHGAPYAAPQPPALRKSRVVWIPTIRFSTMSIRPTPWSPAIVVSASTSSTSGIVTPFTETGTPCANPTSTYTVHRRTRRARGSARKSRPGLPAKERQARRMNRPAPEIGVDAVPPDRYAGHGDAAGAGEGQFLGAVHSPIARRCKNGQQRDRARGSKAQSRTWLLPFAVPPWATVDAPSIFAISTRRRAISGRARAGRRADSAPRRVLQPAGPAGCTSARTRRGNRAHDSERRPRHAHAPARVRALCPRPRWGRGGHHLRAQDLLHEPGDGNGRIEAAGIGENDARHFRATDYRLWTTGARQVTGSGRRAKAHGA